MPRGSGHLPLLLVNPTVQLRYFNNADVTRRPMLFGIMSAGADKAGATHSFQQKIFQVVSLPVSAAPQKGETVWSSKGLRLSPIRLDVSNLGASKQTRSYEALTPVAALPPVQLHRSQAAPAGETLPDDCFHGTQVMGLVPACIYEAATF